MSAHAKTYLLRMPVVTQGHAGVHFALQHRGPAHPGGPAIVLLLLAASHWHDQSRELREGLRRVVHWSRSRNLPLPTLITSSLRQTIGLPDRSLWLLRQDTQRHYLVGIDEQMKRVELLPAPSICPGVKSGSTEALNLLFPKTWLEEGFAELAWHLVSVRHTDPQGQLDFGPE